VSRIFILLLALITLASAVPTATFSVSSASSSALPGPSEALSASSIVDTADPTITAPAVLSEGGAGVQEKYHMTTYWSCVTVATQVHCGWHEPVLAGGNEIAAGAEGLNGRGMGKVGVMGVAALVGGALL